MSRWPIVRIHSSKRLNQDLRRNGMWQSVRSNRVSAFAHTIDEERVRLLAKPPQSNPLRSGSIHQPSQLRHRPELFGRRSLRQHIHLRVELKLRSTSLALPFGESVVTTTRNTRNPSGVHYLDLTLQPVSRCSAWFCQHFATI